jgi:hypothetical protein
MINLKACNRCGGDMTRDEYLGDIDLVCLQCGHRQPLPVERTYSIRLRRQAARTERRAA